MNIEKKEKMPSILLCFVPKSAGVYIWHGISVGLNLESTRISGAFFPGGVVMPPLVEEFSKGGYCTHDHLEASWRNKPVINAFLDKMIVNVRDPRMATLEWTYFMNQLEPKLNINFGSLEKDNEKNVNIYEDLNEPGFEKWMQVVQEDPRYQPKGYWSMPLKDQIDVQINTFFLDVIDFINDWLIAEEDPLFKTKILFTKYEDLVKDEDAFWDSILNFYNIEKSLFKFKPFKPQAMDNPKVEGELHYRNSRIDEWKEVFSKEQIKKSTEAISDKFYKRFNWIK